jgi:hypothetical protein
VVLLMSRDQARAASGAFTFYGATTYRAAQLVHVLRFWRNANHGAAAGRMIMLCSLPSQGCMLELRVPWIALLDRECPAGMEE